MTAQGGEARAGGRWGALPLLWPVLLCLAIYASSGSLGFNPSDEGLVLAQARRVVQGGTPHLDIVSPRPLGSALLHAAEFALAGPRLEVSRALALGQLALASWLLAALVFGCGPRHWSLLQQLGAGAALLVNLHTFPLMAWHTIDGVMLVALGLSALARTTKRGGTAWTLAAGLALGAAATVKQSFALAPLVGAAWIVFESAPLRRRRGLLALLVGAALAPAGYGLWVASGGGLAAAAAQLLGARPAIGQAFLLRFAAPLPALGLAGLVGLVGWASWEASRSQPRSRWRTAAALIPIVVVAALIAAGQLRYLGSWGLALGWIGLAALSGRIAAAQRESTGPLLLALAWMTSLSWGNPTPNLVAGSLALWIADRHARELPERTRAARWLRASAVAAFVAIAVLAVHARRTHPYFDRPARELTASLEDVAPGFGGIRTNPTTAAYLRALRRCVDRYPARSVAVLPDNAALYPLLDLDNPFPIDWLFAPDLRSARNLIVARARELDRRGDYLVLAQSVQAFHLARLRELPSASPNGDSFFRWSPLGRRIAAALSGTRIVCGPFAGIYAPPGQMTPRRGDGPSEGSTLPLGLGGREG